MGWGTAHLGLVGLTLFFSIIGQLKESYLVSMVLLAWWLVINLLWTAGGDQYLWTALLGTAFYLGSFVTAMYRAAWLWWAITALFGIVILITVWMYDSANLWLYMTARGVLFAAMCLVVAASWRTRFARF